MALHKADVEAVGAGKNLLEHAAPLLRNADRLRVLLLDAKGIGLEQVAAHLADGLAAGACQVVAALEERETVLQGAERLRLAVTDFEVREYPEEAATRRGCRAAIRMKDVQPHGPPLAEEQPREEVR